jgi:hypothetical protein
MARRAFIADVTALKNSAIASIDNVSIGEDGEDFAFRFKTASGQQVLLRALATGMWIAPAFAFTARFFASFQHPHVSLYKPRHYHIFSASSVKLMLMGTQMLLHIRKATPTSFPPTILLQCLRRLPEPLKIFKPPWVALPYTTSSRRLPLL